MTTSEGPRSIDDVDNPETPSPMSSETNDGESDFDFPATSDENTSEDTPPANTNQSKHNQSPRKTDDSPLSKTTYALSRHQLNNQVKNLRDCGIEEEVKLPKIAVIGNQSAGKSSLIEAISQIKVPRAAGTCTRCPMEVVLNSAMQGQEWQAKVSLRFSLEDPRVRISSSVPFAETKSKDEITLILRRAQLCILNPERSITEFVGLSEDKCDRYPTALRFSKSIVVLEITGADVDVTFVDLPGIISNSDDVGLYSYLVDVMQAEDDVELIKDLVKYYVSQEECLILVTITMKGIFKFSNISNTD